MRSKQIVFSNRNVIGLAAVAFAIAIIGCSPNGDAKDIIFEIPPDYHGFFRLVEDAGAQQIPRHHGVLFVRFAATGLLRVKSIAPLQRYFTGRAKIVNGHAIPFVPIELKNSEDTVVWLLPKASISEVYFYVGNREQALKYIKDHPEIYQH